MGYGIGVVLAPPPPPPAPVNYLLYFVTTLSGLLASRAVIAVIYCRLRRGGEGTPLVTSTLSDVPSEPNDDIEVHLAEGQWSALPGAMVEMTSS